MTNWYAHKVQITDFITTWWRMERYNMKSFVDEGTLLKLIGEIKSGTDKKRLENILKQKSSKKESFPDIHNVTFGQSFNAI